MRHYGIRHPIHLPYVWLCVEFDDYTIWNNMQPNRSLSFILWNWDGNKTMVMYFNQNKPLQSVACISHSHSRSHTHTHTQRDTFVHAQLKLNQIKDWSRSRLSLIAFMFYCFNFTLHHQNNVSIGVWPQLQLKYLLYLLP